MSEQEIQEEQIPQNPNNVSNASLKTNNDDIEKIIYIILLMASQEDLRYKIKTIKYDKRYRNKANNNTIRL